jgi:phosphatidylinositol alpha-1,6-mannosyltransferase
MRVVFWQNILSFYQVPHMAALAAHRNMEVVWVVREAITPDRVAQGWKVPEVSGVQVVVAPDDGEIKRLVAERPEDSVHIFSGIHQDMIARKAFYLSIKTSARIGLLNEAPFPGRLRDLVSPIFHRGHRLLYGRRISFILAMGHMAVDFYRSVGYSASVVFPYGYFPDAPTHPVAAPPKGPVQIMYLGQLIERKGVDLLLTALGQLRELEWHLTIVGGGDQKEALTALGKELGLEDRLTFYKSLENQAAMQLMEQSDFFVLPSRHDGWGVVVNEALLRGVPVICSDRCGASDLLKEPWRGETFGAGSASSLEASLRRWISHGKRAPLEAEKIKNWSRCIERTAVSDYLLQIIQFSMKSGPRPVTPWLEISDEKSTKKSRSAE